MTVIHFVKLDELLDELPPGSVVRVVALETTESTSDQYGIRLVGYGVHARATLFGEIYSWYYRARRLQLVGNIYHGHGQEKEHRAAWAAAEAAAEEIKAYIVERGYQVRPGIIDLEGGHPIPGTWEPRTQEESC